MQKFLWMFSFLKYFKKISIKFILVINLLFTTFVLLFWIIDRKIPPIGSSINKLLKSSIYYEKPSEIYKIDSEIEANEDEEYLNSAKNHMEKNKVLTKSQH